MNEASRKPCAWAAVLLLAAWGDSGWSVEMLTASAVRRGKREARSIEFSGKTQILAECCLMQSSGTVCSLSILEASTREESFVGHDTGA